MRAKKGFLSITSMKTTHTEKYSIKIKGHHQPSLAISGQTMIPPLYSPNAGLPIRLFVIKVSSMKYLIQC